MMGDRDYVGSVVRAILRGGFVQVLLRELPREQYRLEQRIQEFGLNFLKNLSSPSLERC